MTGSGINPIGETPAFAERVYEYPTNPGLFFLTLLLAQSESAHGPALVMRRVRLDCEVRRHRPLDQDFREQN